MQAWIAVPVPGAAKVAAFFNHPQVLDALFAQSAAGEQA